MTGRIVRKQNPTGGKLPIMGNIRIGKKVKNAKGVEYPTATDYFVVDGKYAEKFTQAYGEKPNKISIVFVSDDIGQVCNERFECRDPKTGSLLGSGNGEVFKIWDEKVQDYVEVITDNEFKQKQVRAIGKWDVVLTIQFLIPKIKDVFGVWKLTTKGAASSIPNIRDTFDNVRNLAGTVIHVPFDLTVEMVSSQKPGSKKVFPVINLIPNLSSDKLDDIRNFLKAGHDVRDLKNLINPGSEPKQLEEGKGDVQEEAESETSTEVNDNEDKKIDEVNSKKTNLNNPQEQTKLFPNER